MTRHAAALLVLVLGGCVCGPGEASCNQSCSSLLDDPRNCGSCGHSCAYHCANGSCVPPPECGPDAARPDCDDHEPCNGVETCVQTTDGSYHCQGGTRMNCSDGVRCTMDSCTAGVCSSTPVDSTCGAGMMCDAALDCVTRCDHSVCGLVEPQCGCPSGQGCYATGAAAGMCETFGARQLGSTCTRDNDCRPGTQCVSISTDDTIRMCMAFCDDDRDCSPTDPLCIDRGVWATSEPNVGICSPACNLVTGAGCPITARCALYQTATSEQFTSCLGPIGTVALDGACTTEADCRAGALCLRLSTTGSRVCRQWCRTTADCASGRTCRPINPAIVVNGVSYGACQ